MNKTSQSKRVLNLIFSFALSLGISFPVGADDTEIYTGGSQIPSEVNPNLVFIIDTSGSMSSNVTVSAGSYDPSETYSGSCSSSRIYWSTSGNAPSCGTSNYFLASSNKCDAASTSLNSGGSGLYVTRAARYKEGRRRGRRGSEDTWDGLSSRDHDDPIECQDDFGDHGETAASANVYPADENDGGPWTSNVNNAINWNRTGTTYTLYSANYLNWRNSPGTTTTKTRLEIVQEVFSDLMDSISNINISVMRFDNKSQSYNKGGYFIMPMQELTDANRDDYRNAVNALTPNGYTPLAESMYESYLFYKGAAVKFGDDTDPGTNVAGVLDPDNTSNYESPIEYQCQKNFVILLTDGEPTYDTNADSDIQGLPGFSTVTGTPSCSGNCLDELADYMYTKDCSGLDDTQNVITYTIGFHTDQALLSNAATKGGGKYYTADDTAGLTEVFTSILTEIMAVNTTFIAPAVSVNAFNRFNHRDELYYALFQPSARPTWNGNIKRYRLTGNPPVIVDSNNNVAIDANTGFFKPTATSFWTPGGDGADGDSVRLGGAASKMALPRTVYTYTSSTAPNNASLSAVENALHEDNAAITKDMLGDATMTDDDRTDILQWARGIDLFDEDSDTDVTDPRRHLGDPLHTKPVLITYGGTDANPDITLYAGTNEGYFHAINTTDGTEVFTFVPQELLPSLVTLFDNAGSNPHPYGLDGPLTKWVNDVNGNGLLYDTSDNLETGEHVYLYQAMRRGGKNLYALNVTNRSTPKVKWMIQGGTGDFAELAQTWSSAAKAKIKLNGVSKDVLIFAGGYDVDQDDNETAEADDEGRAIFIVDASTGAEIWQAGPAGTGHSDGSDPDLVLSGMTNSIPSDITILDMDRDGYADRLYVGDMGARIWRFDIDGDNTGAGNLATGGVIANLGDNTAAGNRRFFYAPDVSMTSDNSYLNISIGSGYRAHPLNTAIHDAFFVIRDTHVFGPALDANDDPVYTAITLDNLFDTTDNTIGEGTEAEKSVAEAALDSSHGFFIYMNEESDNSFVGEKVLAKSLTIGGNVMFTTYKPVANQAGACSPSQGSASGFLINIDDGTPVHDFDNSGGELTRIDRRIDLVRGGIPPGISVIFSENGVVGFVGTEKIEIPSVGVSPEKTYWHIQ